MLLAYISRTNNIQNIVNKLSLDAKSIINISDNPDLILEQDFCLLTYTDFLGQIPDIVLSFLSKNSLKLKAVAGSGNRNFGRNFCGAAKKIQELYHVPIVALFELSGDDESIRNFKEFLITH
ncbi:ribonucleotide reductase [Candidatus Mycoplasma haematobovis]|uniref:Ribonucleotide reductase n=1 Tax=Candidatus Mycoplasma haematobovis TaxID=432608 RepID=A0A1A9QE10_9MOLU|nr:class Ib ribonucleoside-diphosphate reductase assembly flavoprotein NrdI [Candidatus Mycoplasma haematobovis]OAL10196.1 ribonucleotide reductase [Candidatus Mycoplasma haematobovis]